MVRVSDNVLIISVGVGVCLSCIGITRGGERQVHCELSSTTNHAHIMEWLKRMLAPVMLPK